MKGSFKRIIIILSKIAQVLIILFALYISITLSATIEGFEDMIIINQRKCAAAEKAAIFVKGFIDENKRIPSANELKSVQSFSRYDLVLYSEIWCMDSRCDLDAISPPSIHVAFPYVIMNKDEVPVIWTLWSNECNKARSPSEIYTLGGREEMIALQVFLLGLCVIAYTYLRRVSSSNGK